MKKVCSNCDYALRTSVLNLLVCEVNKEANKEANKDIRPAKFEFVKPDTTCEKWKKREVK